MDEPEEIAIKIIEAHPELAGTRKLAEMIDDAVNNACNQNENVVS